MMRPMGPECAKLAYHSEAPSELNTSRASEFAKPGSEFFECTVQQMLKEHLIHRCYLAKQDTSNMRNERKEMTWATDR